VVNCLIAPALESGELREAERRGAAVARATAVGDSETRTNTQSRASLSCHRLEKISRLLGPERGKPTGPTQSSAQAGLSDSATSGSCPRIVSAMSRGVASLLRN